MKIITHSKPCVGTAEIHRIRKVISSGRISSGKEAAAFESEMAEFMGLKTATAVSSGTAGLCLAMQVLGIKENDEVIIPSLVCTAVLNAVLFLRAKPVLADSAEECNISAIDVRKRITKRTKAIIVPHLFGQPADMKSLCALGIPIIEDCAQTIGAECQGKMAGQWGEMSVCSFYATKILTTGEGGMVLSNNKKYNEKIRSIIDYDEKIRFSAGFNFKMTDFQAAMGRSQLKKLPNFISRRRYIAKRYNDALAEKSILLPLPPEDRGHIYFRYVVSNVKNTAKKMEAFQKLGISVRKPVFKPLHMYLGMEGFPQAGKIWETSLSLPIYPSLSDNDVERVKNTALKIL